MKIIINLSGNYTGGCFQVGFSFLTECRNLEAHEYHVLLGEVFYKEFLQYSFPDNFYFYRIPLLKWYKLNHYVNNIVDDIKADVAFSIFGPPYVRFSIPHLTGFAQGYYIYPESPYWDVCPLSERIKQFLKKKIHLFLYRKYSDAIVTETTDATERIKRILGGKKKYYTVSNTCNSYFTDYTQGIPLLLPERKEKEFRLLMVCTYRPHKNIESIPFVIQKLLEKNIQDIRFVLTIDSVNFERIFGNEEIRKYVYNVGYVNGSTLPQLYSECDALYLPTFIECFSANYPEAMAMGKNILTSDLGFAHSVCKDAALYFDPCGYEDIATKIEIIRKNEVLQSRLRENGYRILKQDIPSSRQRAERYLEICEEMLTEKVTNSK